MPVVAPKSCRIEPWDHDLALYRRRNEIERLFRRLKGYRRIFTRFEKLDAMFMGFLSFALVTDALRMCRQILAEGLAAQASVASRYASTGMQAHMMFLSP